jgi:hypothetical protein
MSRRSAVFSLVFAFAIIVSSVALAQPPHRWSQGYGSAGEDIAYDVATDSDGNVILAGTFCGEANFGGATLLSAGDRDIFLAKYRSDGTHLWSRSFGDAEGDWVRAVAVDLDGHIFLTGNFFGTIDFGGERLLSAGQDDMFLAVFDPLGNHVWSDRWGGPDRDVGFDVEPDRFGDVYLIGSFTTHIDFGGGSMTSAGSWDVCFAKLRASDGAHRWSQRFGDDSLDLGLDVAVSMDGFPVISGSFYEKISFGGSDHYDAGSGDIYLARFDPSGDFDWSRSFGGSGVDSGADVTVDVDGNILLLGSFSSTVDFGGGSLTSAGGRDVVLAKYRPNGDHLFSNRYGGAGQDFGSAVTTHLDTSIFLTGQFESDIDLGGGALDAYGASDVFVARLRYDGSHLWSLGCGSSDDDHAHGLAVDDLGEVSVAGDFQGFFYVGDWYLSTFYPSIDAFLVKLDLGGTRLWMDGSGGWGFDLPYGLATGPACSVHLAGIYGGNADFGGDALPYSGDDDVFVAQYDAAGDHRWSHGFGSAEDDHCSDVVVDSNADVYLTGHYYGQLDFGGGPLVLDGISDMFLAKLDVVGNHVWSTRVGPGGQQGGIALALDPDENVVVVGEFTDSLVVGDFVVEGQGNWDGFVAKFDRGTGEPIWCSTMVGPSEDAPFDVVVGPGGNIFVLGEFTDTIDCGGGPLTSHGFQDIFLASYDADGNHRWSAAFGASDDDDFQGGISIDATGNIYIGGRFWGEIDFGGGVLQSWVGGKMFLAKFDPDGNHQWSVNYGGYYVGVILDLEDIIVDLDGDVIAGGFFTETADFGSGVLSADEEGDAFLAAYDGTDGSPLWSAAFPGTARESTRKLAIDAIGNLLVTGYFSHDLDLGGAVLHSNGGTTDVFLARYGLAPAGVELLEVMAGSTRLSVAPNPFAGETTVSLSRPIGPSTSVTIHDVSGRRVRSFHPDELITGGRSVVWDGRDGRGRELAPGTYFILERSGQAESKAKVVKR